MISTVYEGHSQNNFFHKIIYLLLSCWQTQQKWCIPIFKVGGRS
jgi:hypothetical protein